MGESSGADSDFYSQGEGPICNIYCFKHSNVNSCLRDDDIGLDCTNGATCNVYANNYTILPIDALSPTILPTHVPSIEPSIMPTIIPSIFPTMTPTIMPSIYLSLNPSLIIDPTNMPTKISASVVTTTNINTKTTERVDANQNNDSDNVFGSANSSFWIVLIICITISILAIIGCFVYIHRSKSQKSRDSLCLE